MLSWVDDSLALGYPDDVSQMKTDLANAFECTYGGELKYYVDSKADIKRLDSELSTFKLLSLC